LKIFILEDSKNRMIKFKRELIGHNIDHAQTVQEGTSFVFDNKYDLIFLDHDLEGGEMVDSFNENTGYRLAEFISFTQNKETPCVIHSLNRVGAENIRRVLPHALIVPFSSLDIHNAAKWVEKCRKVDGS